MEGRIGGRSATGQDSRVHNVNGVKRLEEWASQGIGTANFHRKQKLFDSSGWNFIFSLKTMRTTPLQPTTAETMPTRHS